MCGRFSLDSTSAGLSGFFGILKCPEVAPRYNIAPGQEIIAVRSLQDSDREAKFLHWGLIPHWSKDKSIAYKMINARAETVAEKPSFRSAYRARRCLVPVTGFYEWKRIEKQKQPFYIRRTGHELFALAGIWETWSDKQSEEIIESCAILTTEANTC
jgi:putative SOS response-associated peptidase YedK